jgi:hypothetical protein
VKKYLALFIFALTTMSVYGRDTGYVLECVIDESGLKQIISFLENDTDKRVRFLETATNTMWDTHEWESDIVTIRSFTQAKGMSEASLISSIEINMKTMLAKFVRQSEPASVTHMQCQRWSPQIRNK